MGDLLGKCGVGGEFEMTRSIACLARESQRLEREARSES